MKVGDAHRRSLLLHRDIQLYDTRESDSARNSPGSHDFLTFFGIKLGRSSFCHSAQQLIYSNSPECQMSTGVCMDQRYERTDPYDHCLHKPLNQLCIVKAKHQRSSQSCQRTDNQLYQVLSRQEWHNEQAFMVMQRSFPASLPRGREPCYDNSRIGSLLQITPYKSPSSSFTWLRTFMLHRCMASGPSTSHLLV